jgi:hypothetical protein
MSAHTPSQPGGVSIAGGTNLAFLSSLNVKDRSFDPKLMEVYGSESYMYFMEKIGRKKKVENQEFYHYEVGGKLYPAVQVASVSGGGSAGVVATVTIASGSHRNSGAESPLRVGENVEIMASGIIGKITAINKSVAGAHTATIYPLLATDTFNPAASDWLLFKGLQDVGEASDTYEGIQNTTRKVTNTTTQIREDYPITDLAAMERVEWEVNGVPYFKYKGTRDTDKRFNGSIEDKLVFGVQITNTNLTSNGATGTKGAINQISSGGSSLQYTQGAMDISDYQAIARILDANGAPHSIHHLCDPFQFQEIQNSLFAKYPNGAIVWDTVGGSKEAAAKYGFAGLHLENYDWFWKKYAPFSPEWKYGIQATSARYRHFGMIIPQGSHTDPKTSEVSPTFQICYQNIPNHGEYHIYEHGGLASRPTGGKQNIITTYVTNKGLQLKAANQCILFEGA